MAEFLIDKSNLEYKPKYQVFHSLMKRRVKEILLVSSAYDNFILEEDGRLSDQIYAEFHELNLRTLPHITRVESPKDALKLLKKKDFDLVVTMRRLFQLDPYEFGLKIKKIKDIPVVLLLTSLSDINFIKNFSKEETSIDLIFLWNGNSDIFVSMTKLLEDRMNLEYDTKKGLVRVIIIVEDSIRFYSSYIPLIYSEIMHQVQRLISSGVNDYYRLLQMRARPKIILTHTYEDAINFYQKYKKYVIGIISDINFPKNNQINKLAGIELIKYIKKQEPTTPTILQSSDFKNKLLAEEIDAHFIHKQSETLLEDIRKFMLRYMGFGDFIFQLSNGKEVARASNLKEFEKQLNNVSEQSLYYHSKNDNFSGWLMARGEFRVASSMKLKKVSDFKDLKDLRTFLVKSVHKLLSEQKNIVTDYRKENFNPDSNFIRLRPGSLGGKGRGLAFLMFLINPYKISDIYDINIPQTIAIGTEEFDRFMDDNNLYGISLSANLKENDLCTIFKDAKLSQTLKKDLIFILERWKNHPIAVRSSSIVEDSQFQPFAGVFSTFMIPNQNDDIKLRFERIFEAIKMVYASTFSKKAKTYSKMIHQRMEEVKMGIVIQKVVGNSYNKNSFFYPNFSGLANSYNYYPIGKMKPKNGISFLALGLGRIIVNGGNVRRFCPNYPNMNFYSNVNELIKNSQNDFFAIDLKKDIKIFNKEECYLKKLSIIDAKNHGTLKYIADTYNHDNDSINAGYWTDSIGSPIITFNRFLKYDKNFPLAKIIREILIVGEKAMGSPVEIEFAGNFRKNKNDKHSFSLLQIRPIIEIPSKELKEIDNIKKKNTLIYATSFSGNQIIKNIKDIIFVKKDSFDNLKTIEMVSEIESLNKKMVLSKKPYLLIVFGRLGTYDKHLGIPLKEYNITMAKVIVETGKENFKIEPSQGTHFFQNMITTKMGFIQVKYGSKTDFIDWEWLSNQKVCEEKKYIKHINFENNLLIILDGKRKIAIIKKAK